MKSIDVEDLWERNSEAVEVIRCDMRYTESLMNKRDFLSAIEAFKHLLLASPTREEIAEALEDNSDGDVTDYEGVYASLFSNRAREGGGA